MGEWVSLREGESVGVGEVEEICFNSNDRLVAGFFFPDICDLTVCGPFYLLQIIVLTRFISLNKNM